MSRLSTTPCPSEDLLLAFAAGKVESQTHAGVVQHLGECDACLAAIGDTDGESIPGERPRRDVTAFHPKDVVGGRYEITRFIARGGMGEVYEAEDTLLGVRVALKTMLLAVGDDPRSLAQIRREVRLARAINHPGVCRVFDLGEHFAGAEPASGSRRFFLTMEFLDGVTLGQRIRAEGALDGPTVIAIACQLADGLTAAHRVGVVHRDFKSDNVMLLKSLEAAVPRAVIMDFGLARDGQGTGFATTGGLMVGSAAYMAPEQVQGGPVREGADIYAFGVVLFEAVTGRLPFLAPTLMATAIKRLFEGPPTPRSLVATLDPRVETMILRCLARDPADRYPSMSDVRSALAEMQLRAPPAPPAPGRPRRLPPRSQPARLLWLVAAGGLAVGMALLWRAQNQGVDVPVVTAPSGSAAVPTETESAEAVPGSLNIEAAPVPTPANPPTPPGPVPAANRARTAVTRSSASARRVASKTTAPDRAPVDRDPDRVAPPQPAATESDPAPRSHSPLDGFGNPFR